MKPTPGPSAPTTYLYIDEAGNLDFGEHGTRFFTLTGVVMRRPLRHLSGLLDARYDALAAGLDVEYFHAIVVDKRELTMDMRRAETLYPAAFTRLMDTALTGEEVRATAARVIVVTDTLPVRRERSLVTKAVKRALHERAKGAFEHWVFHHASRSDMNLQVADYLSWCVYRRAARADVRSFSRIEACVRSIVGLA
jgi:hypothetical protein